MKRILKYSLVFLVALGIVGVTNHLQSQKTNITQAETVKFEEEITLDPQKMVYQTGLLAPYKTMDTFISDEKSADFAFTSVGGSWEEEEPEGTNILSYVRFKIGSDWSEWLELEVEDDLVDLDKKYAFASSNPADAMQYKYEMYGDGISRPYIKNVEWTFINAMGGSGIEETPQPMYSSNAAISNVTHLSLSRNTSNVKIISRKNWGAKESYRYMSNNDEDPILAEISSEYYQKYKDELTFSRVVNEDKDGDKYVWPLQYPEKVKKIVVHHTATTKNLDNPKQAIRDIYYYHAVTRGWGDIGYNYVIDPDGKVYEGRYGGEGVIGAHAGGANNGSVGIALLGNFQDSNVPQKAFDSLGELVAEKSNIHGINPNGKSSFRGTRSSNVIGHKDVAATSCPGDYMYDKLTLLRSLAVKYQKNEKEKYKIDYDFIDESELFYIEMNPNQKQKFTVKLENIGKKNWGSGTYLLVDDNPEFSGVIDFPDKDGTVLAKMKESSVKPGKTGTFTFEIESGKTPDSATLYLAIMYNGTLKSLDYVIVPMSVNQASYSYKLVDSKYPSKTMDKEKSFKGWVKLKNTGSITWTKDNIVLKSDHDQGHTNVFTDSDIVGKLKDKEVEPGETGTFNLILKAPSEPGYYKEYFTPVYDDIWLKDTGMYFETTIYGGKYAADVEEVMAKGEWKKGKSYIVYIKLRNLGKKSWSTKDMTVDVTKDMDLDVKDAKLTSKNVKSGEAGYISFTAKVSNDETFGPKTMTINPKIDGNELFKDGIKINYRVVQEESAEEVSVTYSASSSASTKTKTSTTTSSSSTSKSSSSTTKKGNGSEEDIRIKLSFDGNPEISANGDVDVYSGSTHIGDLKKGKSATVNYSGGKYKVKIGNTSYSKSKAIRFVPEDSDTILEIENYDNSPGWSNSLNDNKYRGILEVNRDGDLIVINELPLEDYMKGIGEVSNTEEYEKIKAIIVAARTYALYYIEEDQKFPGKPYDLDDDPNTSQKYLGYGMEDRSPQVVKAVKATKGQVVTYDGDLVKTPYFSQSNGTKTKSAKSVWGWSNTPHLVSVSDSYCDANSFAGHGVGLSGCGARGMAEDGDDYLEILNHYYTGIEVTDLY
jgi:hypothetical protein